MNRKMAFFYADSVEKETSQNVANEASKRGYEVEFVDLRETFQTDADISLFTSHAPTIRRLCSKVTIIMLHDLGQAHFIWPNFWLDESWSKFTAGFVPGDFWKEMAARAMKNNQKQFLPFEGVYAVGWPKSDDVVRDEKGFRKNNEAVRQVLKLKYDKTILYAPSWEIDGKTEDVIASLKNAPYNVLLKQRASLPEEYHSILRNIKQVQEKYQGKFENVHFVDPQISIMTYLGLADVVVSDESSVLIEGLLLDVPGIAVTDWRIPDTTPPRPAIVPFEHCIKVKKKDLRTAVDRVFSGECLCNTTQRFKTLADYKNHWFSNFGKASEVAMDRIEEIVDRYEKNALASTVTYGQENESPHQGKRGREPTIVVHESAIDYSDSSESLLLNLCSHSEFDEDSSWKEFPEWEIYYHLSPLRKNLINWLDFGERPVRFLELGAGCGALTSHLVRLRNVCVTAVEGSVERAQVIRKRCQDAQNLEIHACNITQFPIDEPYDFVSLIGVLEYAGLYVEAEDPFGEVLAFAKNALKEDGCLLLAIENQVGHKYLAGYPEEHDGRPFEGISNYPNYTGMRTFDAATLRAKLDKAGLPCQDWFYPFPDYKMPRAILSESALNRQDFDAFALMEFPTQDDSCQVQSHFNERGFMHVLKNLGQMSNFMNSFFVIASKTGDSDRLQVGNLLAVKPNVQRAPEFHTCTFFIDQKSFITVEKERKQEPTEQNSSIGDLVPLRFQKYHHGFESLQEKLLDAIFTNRLERAWDYLQSWLHLLEQNAVPNSEAKTEIFETFCSKHLGRSIYHPANQELWTAGHNLDLIFSNILIGQDRRSTKVIDLEWQLFFDIPLALVYDRALFYLSEILRRNARFIGPQTHPENGLPLLLHDRLQQQRFGILRDLDSLSLFENWFYIVVQNGSFDVSLAADSDDRTKFISGVFKQAQQFAADGHLSKAIEGLSKVLLLTPNDSSVFNELGVCYFKDNQHQWALEAFMQAVRLDPNNRYTVLNLSDALRELGHHSQAIKILSSFTKTHSTDVEALLSLANLYRTAGNEPSSVENYKSALVLDPSNETALQAICNQ